MGNSSANRMAHDKPIIAFEVRFAVVADLQTRQHAQGRGLLPSDRKLILFSSFPEGCLSSSNW